MGEEELVFIEGNAASGVDGKRRGAEYGIGAAGDPDGCDRRGRDCAGDALDGYDFNVVEIGGGFCVRGEVDGVWSGAFCRGGCTKIKAGRNE